MLEQLSIPHYRAPPPPYPPAKGDMVGGWVEHGENVTGAANQQERLEKSRILRDWMSTSPMGEGTVRPSQRCEEVAGDRGPPSGRKVLEATA